MRPLWRWHTAAESPHGAVYHDLCEALARRWLSENADTFRVVR